jgi:hypothetical protein
MLASGDQTTSVHPNLIVFDLAFNMVEAADQPVPSSSVRTSVLGQVTAKTWTFFILFPI